jgi:beta-N-acetylhexosaminidase
MPTARRLLSCAVAVAVLAACGSGSRAAPAAPAAPASSAVTASPPGTRAPVPPPSTVPPCTNASQVARWPLAQRAAQLVVVPALDGDVAALGSAFTSGVGGVLLVGPTMPADLAAQLAGAQQAAATPLFVMTDQEGGGVQRLAGLVPSLPWPREMALTMTPAEVEAAAEGAGRAMRALGVNMDLAPVLDVDGGAGPNATDPDGYRSFSADPATAATYGVAFVRGLMAAGVTPVVKHFPGLGGATGNTDNGPAATQSWPTVQAVGLPPFRAAVRAGAPAVMVANASVPGLSAQPASLSATVIGTELRQQLGFAGLVVTDSLSAGAVTGAGYNLATAAVAAVAAGADMVLFGSTLTPVQSPANVITAAEQMTDALATAVTTGSLPEARLDQAVLDILAAKHRSLC